MSDRPHDEEILAKVKLIDAKLDQLAAKLVDPTKRLPDGLGEDSTVTGRLRLAVTTSGETIKAIAARAGIDNVALGRFVKGTKDFNGETIDKLAAALGLTLADIHDTEERHHENRD